MSYSQLILKLLIALTLISQVYSKEEIQKIAALSGPLPKVLQQQYNDCVINAVCSAIEYVTTPKTGKTESNPLLPLRPSRSGLYMLAKYHAFSSLEEWKRGDYHSWRSDYGVSLGDAFITLDRCGCFPEEPVTLRDGYKVPGWSYCLQDVPVSPDMFRIAFDSDFDGISDAMEPLLLEGSIIHKKDICKIENPYARVYNNIVYELIERPSKFDDSFFNKIKEHLCADKPIVVSISATEDFMNLRGNGPIVGKGRLVNDMHVVLMVGYGHYPACGECAHIQNSWGTSWGCQGRALLTRGYLEKYFYGGYAVSIPGFFN